MLAGSESGNEVGGGEGEKPSEREAEGVTLPELSGLGLYTEGKDDGDGMEGAKASSSIAGILRVERMSGRSGADAKRGISHHKFKVKYNFRVKYFRFKTNPNLILYNLNRKKTLLFHD